MEYSSLRCFMTLMTLSISCRSLWPHIGRIDSHAQAFMYWYSIILEVKELVRCH